MEFWQFIRWLTAGVTVFIVAVIAVVVISTKACRKTPIPTALRVNFVGGSKLPDRRGDVVFIHGLDGDYKGTWSGGGDGKFYFPEELSKEKEFEDIGFWSVDYPASSSAWYGGGMPIEDRAKTILDYLHMKGLGDRPIVFVTHSLGGLVAKQMVVYAYGLQLSSDWANLKKNTKGVAFLATPHGGSAISTCLQRLPSVLPGLKAYRASDLSAQLQRNLPMLRNLNDTYKQTVPEEFQTLALFEGEPVAGGIVVVDPDSADVGMTHVVAKSVDANHQTICKPGSVDDPVYMYIVSFIKSALRPPPSTVNETFPEFHKQHSAAVKRGGDAVVAFNKQYLNGQVEWTGFVVSVLPATDNKSQPSLMITDVEGGNFLVMAMFTRKNFPGGIAPSTKIRVRGIINVADKLGATLIDCEKLSLPKKPT